MRLVMLGLPAAGKGTQGRLLSERYGIPHVSTGSMFRDAMRAQTDLGRRTRAFIETGELVPDGLAVEIVEERLKKDDCRRGFLLDGFPRTVEQAESLEVTLAKMNISLDAAVNIQISEAEAIRRIANRRVCAQCSSTTQVTPGGAEVCDECGGPLVQRPDDNEETARNRLLVYLAQTQPVVDFYRKRGLLVPVNGLQPVEKVFAQIIQRLSRLDLPKRANGNGRATGITGVMS
ncbi:MAG TPA: adenylate kinase [Firmicutes bacterium]|nr:adenylate kinase [Bacillota bacterium]